MATHILLLFILFAAANTITSGDISAETAALLSLRSALGGRSLFWDANASSPCAWQGVHCDDGGNSVTVLRLPGSSLSGPIPFGVFSNLTSLKTLSLRLNRLSGPLPDDLSQMTSLRNLYLQGNMFSGPVPESLFKVKSLVRLNLGENSFTGEISGGFNDLKRLRTLYLQNNGFTGALPDLSLPNLDQFNVSFNPSLNGSVPKGLVGLSKDSFLGTSLCGKPLDSVCSVEAAPTNSSSNGGSNADAVVLSGGKRKRGLSGGAIAGIVIGSVVGLLLLVLIVFFVCRKRNSVKARSTPSIVAIKDQESSSMINQEKGGDLPPENGSSSFSVAAAAAAAMSVGNGNPNSKSGLENGATASKKLVFFGNGSRVFDLEELLRASAEVLGKGTFGTSYKAVLEVGTAVAVKRLKDVVLAEGEFKDRIEGVGAMDHENLVPLRAYYYSREEKLLVYDYMPMGSLSALLHGNKGAGRTPLNWEIRSKIAHGAAIAIQYLHAQSPTSSHGNIKSSNVLLTKSHDPRVADFGLNQIVGPPTAPQRALGYRAPEVTDPRKVSQKADVYSLGVLLLELLTGKPPSHSLLNEEGVDLPRWVQSVVREEWTSEVFDLELLRYDQSVEGEMVELLQLGIDCTAQFPDSRPSISEVVGRIEELRRAGFRGGGKDDHVSEVE